MQNLISRQDAIDTLAKFVPYAIYDKSTQSYTNGLTDAYYLILQLPSAQPEEDCDTCKHGYFGDTCCNNCKVSFRAITKGEPMKVKDAIKILRMLDANSNMHVRGQGVAISMAIKVLKEKERKEADHDD